MGKEALITSRSSLWNDLTKASPSNLSVVGPKKIGKTVLLDALLDKARADGSPYSIAVCWRLGDSPPQSDEEFVEGLCKQLSGAMEVCGGKYEMHQEYLAEEQAYPVLKEVMDLIGQQDERILMIWDGFDKPLSQGRLSETLFGQLRDLFNGKPHKVVTATRATQSKLARKKEVEDSPFWNMFEINPVPVGPFENDDLEEALRTASISATRGGKKEILNWTGGHPVLLLSLLNELANADAAEIDNDQVNLVATAVAENLAEFLDGIWDDFPQATRDSLLLIDEQREVDRESIGREHASFLVARGVIRRDGRKYKSACRMLSDHVQGASPDTSTLSRLFGDWPKYRREIRSVLQLRLDQIRPVNARLQRLVKRSLEDIPEFPDDCLNNLTSIEELALDAVWASEFPDSQIPSDICAYWTSPPRDRDNIISAMMDADDWRIPRDRFKQLAILQRLTGSKLDFDAKAKSITKDTYVLLNAIHQFRNRTEHADGQAIHVGVAVSAVLLCVELLSCLEREIAAGPIGQTS